MDKFDELKKFKELADNGVITQEEFEKKKTEILEKQDVSVSKVLDGFISGAKEKTENAKTAANEKIEEIKKKQSEEAEIKRAEAEKQKAEKAREAEEKKQREAEEKRIRKEEKLKQKAEKKELAKKKRKEFFAKRSVRVIIGVVLAVVVAFVGLCIYAYITRETIKDDISDMKEYKVNNLVCSIPTNWTEDKDAEQETNGAPEMKAFNRQDQNGDIMAVLYQYYLGDDRDIEKEINQEIDDTWTQYDLNIESDNYLVYSNTDTNENGVEVRSYVAVVEKDYSVFKTFISVRSDTWEQNAVDTLLAAPLYNSYKNSNEAERLDVKYVGSKDDGYVVNKSDIEVTVTCKDKEPFIAESFEIEPNEPIINNGESTTIHVKCHGLDQEMEVKGKQVKEIVAKYSGDTKEGVVIEKGNKDLSVTVKWDDGTEETVSDYEMDKTIKLKAGGTGEAKITAFGQSTTLKVECSTMSESQYKNKCKTRSYKNLLRDPSYGEYTKIYGKVLQDCGGGYYRITSGGSSWDDVYMVGAPSGKTLVEDDWVTCYGLTTGIYEYTTVMGASQKVPWLTATYVDID